MTIQGTQLAAGVIGATAFLAAAVSIASCAPPPPNVTAATFQQAQKMDVVCVMVNDANGIPLASPVPVEETHCAPVPANVSGATLPYHLYALVTQTTLGALAVVDLTAGNVVDIDRFTPGVDFIPVGANPTDVAVAPQDARFTFVASGDPNKMAIYVIDNTRLLGNSAGTMPPPQPLRLTDLPACALPQRPQALAVVPTSAPDGGASSASYALIALLGASAGMPAAVVTIDPLALALAAPGSLAPCTAGGAVLAARALSGRMPSSWTPGPSWPDGVPYADASGVVPVPQCVSSAVDAGTADGGNDRGAGALATEGGAAGLPPLPPHPVAMVLRHDMPVLYVADEAVPVIHVIDLHDPANPLELDPLLATSLAQPARRVAVGGLAISPTTRDFKTYLYAIDARQGTLMVFDITDPASSQRTPLLRPHPELNPLAPLDRIAFAAPVAAVAFAQHDWPLPSQADPQHQYTGLLCNPNPNAHPDAGAFVDLGAYYRADRAGSLIQAMDTQGGTVQTLPTRLRGVFGFVTLSTGSVVTIDVDDWDAPCRRPDPMAIGPVTDPFDKSVTYSGGTTGALDIPEPSSDPGDLDPYHAPISYNGGALSESAAVTLEAFFPVSAPHRLRSNFLLRNDPVSGVHVPNLVGVPQLFNAGGAPMATAGPGSAVNPLLLPAPLPAGFIDPTYFGTPTEANPNARGVSVQGLESASLPGMPIPSVLFPGGSDGRCGADAGNACSGTSPPGVRVSFDDPTAHRDQDWTLTYEGALPTAAGITASIRSTLPVSGPDAGATSGAYETLTLSAPGASFCARGIEDWSVGQARANQVLAEMARVGLPAPPGFSVTASPAPSLPQWTSDYVEISDGVLGADDPYWAEPSSVNDCWDGALADPAGFSQPSSPRAQDRYSYCQDAFGAAADADTHLARDLPILHAHDDALEVGRFGWYPTDTNGNAVPELTTNRVVVPADPSNQPFLRLVRCCFHHQANFNVRTGGEWVAVGSQVGLLHRIVKDSSGSCVPSCDPRDALMNARAFGIPWSGDTKNCAPAPLPTFDRDSPLAMRNPMFSFVMWSGCGAPPGYPGAAGAGDGGGAGPIVPGYPGGSDHTLATRDLVWKFSMRGSFTPLTVSVVNPNNGSAVSPQSMRFIRPLGQLAVVDGENQGLVLIDLNLVAVARSYF